jgi:hypothetical protein
MPEQQFVGATRLQFSANAQGATKCPEVFFYRTFPDTQVELS